MTRLAPLLLLLAACGAPPRPALTPDEERVLRPVPDAPGEICSFIDRGDEIFISAIPEKDPQTALDLYGKARRSYLEAQSRYSALVPPPLIDRVRECVTRIAVLQRQFRAPK